MKAHPFDITSFLFAAIFGSTAVAYLLAEQRDWDVDGRWVLPAALIALGIAGIAGAVSGLRSTTSDRSAEVAEEPADQGD